MTVSGGMEGLCRGYRRLAGSAWCGFRRQAGHLNAAGGRHRCGSSCATGAGRTAPAAGNGGNTAVLPRKGRGGGQRPFRGIFRLYGGFPPDHGGVQRRHRLQKSLPTPRFLVSPGTGSPEPTRYRPRGGMRPHNSKTEKIVYTNTDYYN